LLQVWLYFSFFFVCNDFFFKVVHHLNWVEENILIVGYLTVGDGDSSDYIPSLAMLEVDCVSRQMKVLADLKEPVCTIDRFEEELRHKYITRYLPEWEQLIVSSNLSSECWIVDLSGAKKYSIGDIPIPSMVINEPEDEKQLRLPIDDGLNTSY
jgi:hypothetical protein